MRLSAQFALSRRAGRGAKPVNTSSEAFTPLNQPAQPRMQPTYKGDSSNSQGAAETVQSAGSGRSQKPVLEPGTAGMTGRQNTESQIAQEVAAENKKLIVSMQPDEASASLIACIRAVLPLQFIPTFPRSGVFRLAAPVSRQSCTC